MVQILPPRPDWGTQWANVLAGAGKDLGQGLAGYYEQKKTKTLLDSALQVAHDPNATPQQVAQAILSIPSKNRTGLEQVLGAAYGQAQQRDIDRTTKAAVTQKEASPPQEQIPPASAVPQPTQAQTEAPPFEQVAEQQMGTPSGPNPEDITTWSDQQVRDASAKGSVRGQKEEARRLLEHKETSKEGRENVKLNEPKLLELYEKLDALENQDTQFQRLEELSQSDKLPSRFSVAAFAPSGELGPKASALLSPEAQEFVKLITDQISGAKEFFGSRVTNYDLQTFLKRLPSLLNSPEGRQRVLRDLRLVNEGNRLLYGGILEEYEQAGGSDKITHSTAYGRARNRLDPQLKALRNEYIRGPQDKFKGQPPASAYKGQRIRDDSTGELLESDGTQWLPVSNPP